jgi:hypothetical protein
MKFDNDDTVTGIHSAKLIMAIIAIILIVLLMATGFSNFLLRTTGIDRDWAIAIILLLYILFSGYFYLRRASYFSYNDEGKKIIIRYFLLRPFKAPKISIEVNKSEFYRFTIEKKFLRRELNIFVRNGNKVSRYPAISISSLTGKQLEQLVAALNGYVKDK